jgi:hypothetical protein
LIKTCCTILGKRNSIILSPHDGTGTSSTHRIYNNQPTLEAATVIVAARELGIQTALA